MKRRNLRITRLGLLGLLLAAAGSAPASEPGPVPAIEVIRREQPQLPILVRGECWMPWRGQLAYGRPLMTLGERRRYRIELNKRRGCRDQQEFWLSHVESMQRRALALGVSIPEPPHVPGIRRTHVDVYARHLMGLEEREEFQRQYGALESNEERRAFEQAHVERMQERARRWSMSLRPPLTDEQAQAHAEAAEKAFEARAWSEVISTIRANQKDPDRKKPRTMNLLGQ